MKILASLLCVFLILLCTGSLAYVYILWKHYWIRIEKLQKNAYRSRNAGPVVGIHFDETTNSFVVNNHPIHLNSQDSEVKPKEPDLQIPNDKLMEHVSHYEKQIVSQLRNAVTDTGKSFDAGEIKNSYRVNYNGSRTFEMQPKDPPEKLVCSAMKRAKLATFVKGDPFFRTQELDRYFMDKQIFEGKTFDSCGVVSSSGSLSKSGLGARIDRNDFVIRFNNAPVIGYEKDVGSKTSLRIVNSQVVGKPEFRFLESKTKMYSKAPVLVWDPSGYNSTTAQWYTNPDYPFFETFFSKRLMRPNEELYLLRPESLWSIWNWLQSYNRFPLLPNPPSSGFLGLILALRHCRIIHIYEYMPSMRLTKKCHYYDEEENLGCTIGDWHPLAAEKLMALALNVANKSEVFSDGYLTVKGASNFQCQ